MSKYTQDIQDIDTLIVLFKIRKKIRCTHKVLDEVQTTYPVSFDTLIAVSNMRKSLTILWQEVDNEIERLF